MGVVEKDMSDISGIDIRKWVQGFLDLKPLPGQPFYAQVMLESFREMTKDATEEHIVDFS